MSENDKIDHLVHYKLTFHGQDIFQVYLLILTVSKLVFIQRELKIFILYVKQKMISMEDY